MAAVVQGVVGEGSHGGHQRRAAGLCTLKQARKLRSYGLRDDMSFTEANAALDAIAANKWRAPTTLLKNNRLRAPAA